MSALAPAPAPLTPASPPANRTTFVFAYVVKASQRNLEESNGEEIAHVLLARHAKTQTTYVVVFITAHHTDRFYKTLVGVTSGACARHIGPAGRVGGL